MERVSESVRQRDERRTVVTEEEKRKDGRTVQSRYLNCVCVYVRVCFISTFKGVSRVQFVFECVKDSPLCRVCLPPDSTPLGSMPVGVSPFRVNTFSLSSLRDRQRQCVFVCVTGVCG